MKSSKNLKYKQEMAVFSVTETNSPWREILHLGKRRTLPKYYEIDNVEEGCFYFLEHGKLRLTATGEDGQERLVMIMEKGVIFGEVLFIHSPIGYYHSLRTISECDVVAFPKSILEDIDFCREHPHLILNLVKSLGIKSGAFFSQIYDSNLLDAEGKICRMIAQIWFEQGEGQTVAPGHSQTDIADILSMHRSTVCRVIRKLRGERVIGTFSKNCLEVIAPETLLERGGLL